MIPITRRGSTVQLNAFGVCHRNKSEVEDEVKTDFFSVKGLPPYMCRGKPGERNTLVCCAGIDKVRVSKVDKPIIQSTLMTFS